MIKKSTQHMPPPIAAIFWVSLTSIGALLYKDHCVPDCRLQFLGGLVGEEELELMASSLFTHSTSVASAAP